MLFDAHEDLAHSLLCAVAEEGSWAGESASLARAATTLAAAAETICWLLTAEVCSHFTGLRAYIHDLHNHVPDRNA